MGEPRVCFDANVYNRALNDLEKAGFAVSRERTELQGKYYCADDEPDGLVDMKSNPTGSISGQFWSDGQGRVHNVIDIDDLPRGVQAVLGVAIESEGRAEVLYESLITFYDCEDEKDNRCINRLKTSLLRRWDQIEQKEKEHQERLQAKVDEQKRLKKEQEHIKKKEAAEIRAREARLEAKEEVKEEDNDENEEEISEIKDHGFGIDIPADVRPNKWSHSFESKPSPPVKPEPGGRWR